MIKIKPPVSAGAASILAMPSSQDFGIEFVTAPFTYPPEVHFESYGDVVLKVEVPSYSTNDEPSVFVTGKSEGAQISVYDDAASTSRHKLVGNHIQRISGLSGAAADVLVNVKTKYGERVFSNSFSAAVARDDLESLISQKFEENTAAENIVKCVDNLFGATQAGADANCQFYDEGTYSIDSPSVSPNTWFIFGEYDWSGISIARTNAPGPYYPFILVSPRHAVFAAHCDLSPVVGHRVTYRRPDGTTQTVEVVAISRHPQEFSGDKNGDLAVVYFNAPVVGCKIYKTLPKDFLSYLPSVEFVQQPRVRVALPAILRVVNIGQDPASLIINTNSPKFIRAGVALISGHQDANVSSSTVTFTYRKTESPALNSHMRHLYGGDSGSPVFFLIQEKPGVVAENVLVSTVHTPLGGVSTGGTADWLNDRMNAMARSAGDMTVYELKHVDLSRFKKF